MPSESGLKSLVPTIIVLLLGVAWLITVVVSSLNVNGSFGFPLDDPWIHLQFAKNLHDYGAFSYYKAENVTSGSTSPLYTLMLGIGFMFTSQEFLLSYGLGIAFLLAAVWFFSRWIAIDFESRALLSVGGAALLMFEPRMIWSALSGMETTLFVALLIGTYVAYRRRHGVVLGILSGLLIWTRPEAVIVFGCIGADFWYHRRIQRSSKRGTRAATAPDTWWKPSLAIVVLFATAYAVFNLWLSGSILPNTFAAKLKYYSGGGADFPSQVLEFVAGGHMIVLAVFLSIGILQTLRSLVRREPSPGLFALLWLGGMFVAYWLNLPHLYQEGRYFMPVIPFVLYLAIRGIDWTAGLLVRPFKLSGSVIPASVFLGLIAVQFVAGALGDRGRYADYCRYINERQVKTGIWMRDHLPADAVVGTHDIGAIGFYSGRKIVDMVGLVSPDMIENIGSFDRLRAFLARKGVTHLACLRNWFSVVNQNPLFMTDELQPEIMEVFAFDARRVHFMPQDVVDMVESARFALEAGQTDRAGMMLTQALQRDPESVRTRLLLAKALVRVGKPEMAGIEVENALRLQADCWDAMYLKSDILLGRGAIDSAILVLQNVISGNPELPESYRRLAQIYQRNGLDLNKAQYYLEAYAKRSSAMKP